MTEDAFWDVIDTLDGVIDEDSADLLQERLASLPPEEVEAFAAHLADKVRALARLPIEGAPVPDVSDAGGPALPVFGDSLENLLYAIVVAGRADYSAAIEEPSTIEDAEWDAGEAELLVEAVAAVLWTRAGLDWYEDFDPFLADLPADPRWYETARGSAWKSAPRRYENSAVALDQAINESEEWRAWWQQASLRKIKVDIVVNSDRGRVQIERGRNMAKASFEMDRNYFGKRNAAALESLAAEEALTIMNTIAERFSMTPPPPLPAVPSR